MRRIVPVALLALLLASCDPTGNIPPGANTADVRFVHFVVDVANIDVRTPGGIETSDLPFGAISEAVAVNTLSQSFETRNSAGGAVLGTQAVDLLPDSVYTFFALGQASDFRSLLVADDASAPDDTTYAVRFVHGIEARSGVGIDLYLSQATDSLTSLTPKISNITYAHASAYVHADTAFRRLRLTVTGQTTAIFDTTFAAPFSDSTSITIVGSDKQGGGFPTVLGVILDRAP